MNDKDRDLVQQIIQTAGTAGEHGFAYLVRMQLIDGAGTVLVCVAALSICAYLFKRMLNWQPDDSDAYVPRGIGLISLAIIFIIFACIMENGMVCVLAPEGAAIQSVLHRHS